MNDDAFNADDLKLKPEHLKNLRPVETNPKPKRSKREFIQITREQSDRLDRAKNFATEIVFRHLLFLNWKSPGMTIRLPNAALESKGVYRQAKIRALIELKKLGLIKLKMPPRKSPRIIILNLTHQVYIRCPLSLYVYLSLSTTLGILRVNSGE